MELLVSRSRASSLAGAAVLVAAAALAGQGPVTPASRAERLAVEQAIRLLDAGRVADATRALEDFLTMDPVSPAALAMLVDLHMGAGDATPALPWVERAVGAGPGEPHVQRLWVVSLAHVGLGDSARAVARRWIRDSPTLAEAHLALSDAELAIADTAAAIRVLEAAGQAVDDRRVTLERLADLYVASGVRAALLRTWEALLSLGPSGIVAVVEDARSGAWPREIVEDLWLVLHRGSTSESIRNAAFAALRLGYGEPARRLARAAQPTAAADRSRYLRSYASEATDAGLPQEVTWAADELANLSTRPADRQRWRAVSADMALVVGDTSAARSTFRALLDESQPGDAAHQLASRRLFSVLAASPDDLLAAAGLWESHRRAYPDSALDLARMATELSEGRARAGQLPEAERGLHDARARLTPPEALAVIDAAGARLALFRAEPDSALARLMRATAVPRSDAAAHTRNLRLLAIIEGADALELEMLGQVLLQLLRRRADPDIGESLGRLEGLPAGSARAAILALLAEELHSAGHLDRSTELLRRIVESFPRSAQAPDALLNLARRAIPAHPDAARAWLERLITSYPESALAPLARRLLVELDSGGTRG